MVRLLLITLALKELCAWLGEMPGIQLVSGPGQRPPSDKLPLFSASQKLSQTKASQMSTEDLTLLALQFGTNGWVKINSALPELKRANFINAIEKEVITARLRYIAHCHDELKTKYDIECIKYADACGSMAEADFIHMADSNDASSDSYDDGDIQQGFAQLNCCLDRGIHDLRLAQIINGQPVEENDYTLAHLPFFQTLNLHRGKGKSAARVGALGKVLARLATWLLQSPSVRLYQSSLFEKNPNTVNELANDLTGWHQDLKSIPLDTMHLGSITFWCPLDRTLDIREGDSLLLFATGSHRDLSLNHWYMTQDYSYDQIKEMVEDRYRWDTAGELKVGDCTAHHGMTWHYAQDQPEDLPARRAIAFTFVAEGSRVLDDLPAQSTRSGQRAFLDEDRVSYEPWLKVSKSREPLKHPITPVAFDWYAPAEKRKTEL